MSKAGLEGLTLVLNRRTAVMPASRAASILRSTT